MLCHGKKEGIDEWKGMKKKGDEREKDEFAGKIGSTNPLKPYFADAKHCSDEARRVYFLS